MNVRCQGCQAEVSEWAASCPSCGRATVDAEPIVSAPESEAEPPEAFEAAPPVAAPAAAPVESFEDETARRPQRRSRVVAAIVVAVALVGIGLGIGRYDGGSRQVASGGRSPATSQLGHTTLSPELAGERLFFADQGRTGLYAADGQRLSTLYSFGDGFPDVPIVSGLGLVVYLHAGYAYRTSVGGTAPAELLGPATGIFPGRNGTVGIQNVTAIRYMAPDGQYPMPGRALTVSYGDVAVAQVPLGLVVAQGATESGMDEADHDRISLLMPIKRSPLEADNTSNAPIGTELLGAATALIGVYGATVAWVSCPGEETVNCTLELLDTSNLTTRIIQPPPNSSGFAQGGAFSPGGQDLAVFVRSPLSNPKSTIRLAVLDLATGRMVPVGPDLPAEEPRGLATWSSDGLYLYFGGLTGDLYAELTTAVGTKAAADRLPLASSFSVVGY